MSLYFASNQAKQKAFDRTYRAQARSNFVQGRKLRALIEKENADEALTDQLAGLYTKSVAKVREYDYDRINGLQKRPPEVKKDEPKVKAEDAPTETPTTKTKPQKRTYVHQSTDTDTDTAGRVNGFLNEARVQQFIDEEAANRQYKPTNMRRRTAKYVADYIKASNSKRADHFEEDRWIASLRQQDKTAAERAVRAKIEEARREARINLQRPMAEDYASDDGTKRERVSSGENANSRSHKRKSKSQLDALESAEDSAGPMTVAKAKAFFDRYTDPTNTNSGGPSYDQFKLRQFISDQVRGQIDAANKSGHFWSTVPKAKKYKVGLSLEERKKRFDAYRTKLLSYVIKQFKLEATDP